MRTKGASWRFAYDTNLSYMFYSIFYNYTRNLTNTTIPDGLFNAIDTSHAASGDNTIIYHGVKVSYGQPAGGYAVDVVYTTTPNP
ncbi:MAG: hypothetical protein LBU20_01805 [Candidatus Nomurabacteria bacterium]|jgi:hypothetical protein|nr:hypothetical protein [Candidatus Nomurabacteria bacterium]